MHVSSEEGVGPVVAHKQHRTADITATKLGDRTGFHNLAWSMVSSSALVRTLCWRYSKPPAIKLEVANSSAAVEQTSRMRVACMLSAC